MRFFFLSLEMASIPLLCRSNSRLWDLIQPRVLPGSKQSIMTVYRITCRWCSKNIILSLFHLGFSLSPKALIRPHIWQRPHDWKLSQQSVLSSGSAMGLVLSGEIPGQSFHNCPGERGAQWATEAQGSHTCLLRMLLVRYKIVLNARNKYFCASRAQVS